MLSIFTNHPGEFYALLTAIFWTVTALAFESASLKVGSLSVNIIRLVLGFIFLTIFTAIFRNRGLPLDASPANWQWLTLSGLVGFVFGDLMLFKSYTIIGSRFAMLIMALVPPMAAFFGWILLREKMNLLSMVGMIITVLGISMAILSRKGSGLKLSLKLAPKGVLFAFGGAAGQALGLVLSKLGMQGYDPFSATQIRIIAGISGFAILITLTNHWPRVKSAITYWPAMKGITTGAFFGPFLGVSFSLLSVVYTKAGIASTIMAIVPVLIIPPAIFIFRQKVTWIEVLGAIISISGVSLFFVL
jgi:drug/metabolite transporter (DMT)-like permease